VVGQRVDAVTFTTRTALTHLVALADDVGLREPLLEAFNGSTQAVCIGPVCAAAAAELGVGNVIQPARARLGSMVYEFARRFERAHVEVELRGRRVRIQGRLVVIDDGEPLVLSERERGVLLALADSGGRVLSKAELLRAVWGPGERDTHLAEVAVARLRQRLGDASGLVETVHRRGYRLATP
jgi:uroporphyrinogen-III synthase